MKILERCHFPFIKITVLLGFFVIMLVATWSTREEKIGKYYASPKRNCVTINSIKKRTLYQSQFKISLTFVTNTKQFNQNNERLFSWSASYPSSFLFTCPFRTHSSSTSPTKKSRQRSSRLHETTGCRHRYASRLCNWKLKCWNRVGASSSAQAKIEMTWGHPTCWRP